MTTLERAARACARAFYDTEALDEPIFFEAFSGKSVDWLVEQYWLEFVPEARAVLMAVREPSPEQCMAEKVRQWDKYQWGNAPASEAFTAMIDAILNDGEGE